MKVEYTAMLLGATGNVGGQILELLVKRPMCKKVAVVTRRNVPEPATPKVQQVVVNMDKLEGELAPYAKGVDIALVAFGVGKGSAKMTDEEVRKIEVTYPTAFASAAKQGGARVLAMMTAAGANSRSRSKYLRTIGDKVPPNCRSVLLAFRASSGQSRGDGTPRTSKTPSPQGRRGCCR
jgi:uncharacterized protein YbjT (DUF2867 family)